MLFLPSYSCTGLAPAPAAAAARAAAPAPAAAAAPAAAGEIPWENRLFHLRGSASNRWLSFQGLRVLAVIRKSLLPATDALRIYHRCVP